MAAPYKTGEISIACGIFRAFLMNSEDHLIPERILLYTQEVGWCSLFGFRKIPKVFFVSCLTPPFWHTLLALPL